MLGGELSGLAFLNGGRPREGVAVDLRIRYDGDSQVRGIAAGVPNGNEEEEFG